MRKPPRYRRERIERTAKLAVSYARYSTKLQASIEQQEGTNRDVAEEFGARIVKYFRDEAVSRTVGDRDALIEMFIYLEAHPEIGFIVVNELERMTSGVLQRAKVIELAQRLEITVLTEDIGDVDPFDEEKMQVADQRSVTSKGEVLRVRRRTRRAMKHLINEPGRFVINPCYGMRLASPTDTDGNALPTEQVDPDGRIVRSSGYELHPDEYQWLLKIFELADAGMSDGKIAAWLAGQGALTKRGKRNWTTQTVKLILTNDFYKGVYEWGANEVRHYGDNEKYLEPREATDPSRVTRPSPLGAMVPTDLWERVNAKRGARAVSKESWYSQSGRRTTDAQVFDGRVFCGRCGYRMYGQADRARANGVGVPPFRYSCKKGNAPTRPGREGLDFGPPCTESQSITDRELFNRLAEFGKDGATVPVHRATNDGETVAVLKAANAAAAKAQGRYERNKALYLEGEGIVTATEVKAAKVAWDEVTATVTKLRAASGTERAVKVPDRRVLLVDWTRLATVLANPSLPTASRQAVLTNAGIERFYVDCPDVRIQLAG